MINLDEMASRQNREDSRKSTQLSDLMESQSVPIDPIVVEYPEHVTSILGAIKKMNSSLVERDKSLRSFLLQEFASVKASFSAECLRSILKQQQESVEQLHQRDMRNWVEKVESRWVAHMQKMLEQFGAQQVQRELQFWSTLPNGAAQPPPRPQLATQAEPEAERCPPTEETYHLTEERRTLTEERRPPTEERRPPTEERRPPTEEFGSLGSVVKRSQSQGGLHSAGWEMYELDKEDNDHSWVNKSFQRQFEAHPLPELILKYTGMFKYMPSVEPKNFLVPIASLLHKAVDPFIITVNVGYVAYRVDHSARLTEEDDEDWWQYADIAFQIYFIFDLLLRMCAFRLWFWVSPHAWRWNVFDFFIVGADLMCYLAGGMDVAFLRSLRALRMAGLARIARVVWDVTALRKLLLAMVNCLESLLWAGMFLIFTMCVFAILIMSAITSDAFETSEDFEKPEDQQNPIFNGFGATLKTLFTVIVGSDWLNPHDTLSEISFIHGCIIPVFVVFVNIGMLNIVIGVFADAASRCADIELVADDKIGDIDYFMKEMMQLYREMAPKDPQWRHIEVDKEQVLEFFRKEEVQAYLAAHSIDTSHASLIFKLCDRDGNGKLSAREFATMLYKLKDMATKIDNVVMLHALQSVLSGLEGVQQQLIAQQ
mmetsp:Transcript_38279/g.67523  ORF Transcript_38279/g.67523 Transcript_38279/m.67523 type:complete len:655 (-) Transcript_38279:102-2066(-)